MSDLSKPIRQEVEKFFKATEELENKKLNIIGWKGPKAAVRAIRMPLNRSRRTASNSYAALARCVFAAGRSASFCEPAAQEGKDSRFLRFEALHVAAQFAFGFFFQLKHELAVHVGIQNLRMHVAFAADGRRVAELARWGRGFMRCRR